MLVLALLHSNGYLRPENDPGEQFYTHLSGPFLEFGGPESL